MNVSPRPVVLRALLTLAAAASAPPADQATDRQRLEAVKAAAERIRA